MGTSLTSSRFHGAMAELPAFMNKSTAYSRWHFKHMGELLNTTWTLRYKTQTARKFLHVQAMLPPLTTTQTTTAEL